MPNWVKNIVTTSENTLNKIKEKYFEDGELRFNKIIKMPESLDIRSGTITEKAILYVMSKSEPETVQKLIEILQNTKDVMYDNYWKRLQNNSFTDSITKLEECTKQYTPNSEEKNLGIETLEDLGNIALSNIANYGTLDWYDWCIKNWGTKWEPSRIFHNKDTLIFETAWSTPEPIFKKLSEEFPNDYIEVKYADECYSNYNHGILTFENGECISSTEMDEDFAAEIWDEEIEENMENSKDIMDSMFD